MSEKELDERVQRAVDNFMAGYGCCQSVVAAFADLYGLDEVMAKRIAAGFGGGVGRLRMMCGAVSGIVMLVGLDCGQTEGSRVIRSFRSCWRSRRPRTAVLSVRRSSASMATRKPPTAISPQPVRQNTIKRALVPLRSRVPRRSSPTIWPARTRRHKALPYYGMVAVRKVALPKI